MEPASAEEIMAQLSTPDRGGEPSSADPAGPPAARRPSIATRVEMFLREESQQRGTSWMVIATVVAILLAALVIYGPRFR